MVTNNSTVIKVKFNHLFEIKILIVITPNYEYQ
jgi:hypothetical protein